MLFLFMVPELVEKTSTNKMLSPNGCEIKIVYLNVQFILLISKKYLTYIGYAIVTHFMQHKISLYILKALH